MLDQLEYVYLAGPDGQGDAAIFGDLPPLALRQEWVQLLQDRPAAQKDGDALMVGVPVTTKTWCIWRLTAIPTVTALPKVLTNLAVLSRGYVPPGTRTAAETALQDLPVARRRNAAVLVARLTALLVGQGACSAAMVVAVKDGAARKSWLSDDSLIPVQGQLQAAFVQHNDGAVRQVLADSSDAQDFETVLIAQRLGAARISFYPATTGYGVVLIDEHAAIAAPLVAEVTAALQFSRPISTAPLITQTRKRLAMGAAAVLGLWLAWPAPTWLTVTGTSMPDATVSASVTTDSTLQKMFVRVGDHVRRGQVIAQMFSAPLEERRAQEALQIKIEELSAQAAMSKNDYGGFQLAQQRGEIAKTRLAQSEQRIADLAITAPADGVVVAAIPDSNTGAAVPLGSQIAQIQTAPKFLVRLNPARVDARLLTAGMTGQIYFRGLADRIYQIKMITPPVAMIDPATRAEKLEAFATITSPDDGRLMGGLAGYARVAGPRQIRLFSLTRYIGEFIRVKAWTYLGLAL